MPRTLITGGFGFLGTWIAAGLRRCGQEVILVDNRSVTGSPLDMARLLPDPGIHTVRADITQPGVLDEVSAVDHLVHAAAVLGVDAVRRAPDETLRVNINGTTVALDFATRSPDLRRFVLISTSEVYGADAGDASEDQWLSVRSGDPRWAYGVSKVAAEALTYARGTTHQLPFVVVRPFNVYGALRTGSYAVGTMVGQALDGGPITVHRGGQQTRSWCHAEDFANGVVRCLYSEQAVGEAINLGDARNHLSVAELARRIRDLSETEAEIVDVERPVPDIDRRSPNLAKAAELLGYQPMIGFNVGLRDAIKWRREPAGYRLRLSRPDWAAIEADNGLGVTT